uniref:Uncharacterized protein n=1 Tax=Magallana gigas TaxID=29159 RepID=A0A8W8JKY7_MAGGI
MADTRTCLLKTCMFIVIIWIFLKLELSTATNDACPVSRQTVEDVDDCPDSEEKWKEAAARKNCAAYASQCDEPGRLVYHCVINSFANQTLEVCAYSKIIVLRVCTEYSLSGNRIQQNKINCSNIGSTPCPTGYNSTTAYKYPVCYKLAKENRRKEEPTTNKTDTFSTINSTQNGYGFKLVCYYLY